MIFPLAEITNSSFDIVQDLAAVMCIAGIITALFHWRKWPKVIGYIVAGAVLSYPPIRNLVFSNKGESIAPLANLGTIFLMFGLGLDLNIRRIKKISKIIMPTAILDVLIMIVIGYAIGRNILHWNFLPSLFLGAVLCDSSTTLLAKTLDEMGCTHKHFASVIFGTTIFEDIMTIAVMAALTGLAISGTVQTQEVFGSLTNLFLFLLVILILGFLLFPRLLKNLKKMLDDETLVLIVLGICFFIAYIADRMNFGLALGAFLMGAVVAESPVSQRINKATVALRTMFSAVFFVSIGLMVDLPNMWHCKWYILLLSLVVLLCKTFNITAATFLLGLPHKEALTVGIGLAQLGDFSYLVAIMGLMLCGEQNPTYLQLYQIAVGVSILTTLLNPLLLKASVPLGDWLENKISEKTKRRLESYTEWTKLLGKKWSSQHGDGKKLRKHLVFYLLYTLLMMALLTAATYFAGCRDFWKNFPWMDVRHPRQGLTPPQVLLWIGCMIIQCPIFFAVWYHAKSIAERLSKGRLYHYLPSPLNERFANFQSKLLHFLLLALYLGFIGAYGFLLMPNLFIFGGLIVFFGVILFCCKKQLINQAKMAGQVLEDIVDDTKIPQESMQIYEPEEQYHIFIPETSGAIGHTLAELRLRNRTGIVVLTILRKNLEYIAMPSAKDKIYAGDTILISGTEKQYLATNELLESPEFISDTTTNIPEPETMTWLVPQNSPLAGQTIRTLNLRYITGATIVRIHNANGTWHVNPGPQDALNAGDTLYLQGTTAQIEVAKRFFEKPDIESSAN